MTRLSLTQLAALREFARRGTMAEAADELGYTPGAISQQLTELERAVGVPLLGKVGRRAVLTDAGRVLAAEAGRILDAEERARDLVAQATETIGGTLLLGTWGSSAAALLAPLLETAERRFPHLTVRTREVDPDSCVRAVTLGEVDVAFGLEYSDAPLPRDRSVTIQRLLSERFWVGGSPARLTGQEVSLPEIADEPWILSAASTPLGQVSRGEFRRRGVEPNVRHEVNDSAASLQMAARGLGLTFVTDLLVQLAGATPLGRARLRETFERHLVIVAPANRSLFSATQALIDLAAEVAAPWGAPSTDPMG